MDDMPHDPPMPPRAGEPEEPTERAQRREQILFERERVNARRRTQRVGPGSRGARPPARPHGAEFEAGWWTVEQQAPAGGAPPPQPSPGPLPLEAEAVTGTDVHAEAPAPGSGPAGDADGPEVTAPVTVTVPVTVPMTVPADVWRSADGFHLHLELPGIGPASVEVGFENGLLTVSAERSRSLVPGVEPVRLERPHGTVTRQVELALAVDVAAVRLDYRDGILSLAVPYRAEAPGSAQAGPARLIDLAGTDPVPAPAPAE